MDTFIIEKSSDYFYISLKNSIFSKYTNDYGICSFLGINFEDYKEKMLEYKGFIHTNINGDKEVAFNNIEDAKTAVEWLESIVMANKLRGKERMFFINVDMGYGEGYVAHSIRRIKK